MGRSAGKLMPRPRGAYNESETYKILDMVTLDNKLWIATQSGVTGITPSKTTPEWMMAVDGTTDVKELETEVDAKFAEIDAEFLSKDELISALSTRVTNTEGNITAANQSIEAINNRFVFDAKPTSGSSNLITSGTAYNMVNSMENNDMDDGSYEHHTNGYIVSGQHQLMKSTTDQYIPTDGTIHHKSMQATVTCNYGHVLLRSYFEPMSDNTASYVKEESSSVECSGQTLTFSCGLNSTTRYLNMSISNLRCQTDSVFDLGSSSNKFKDIYASNGTIQTSDSTEKKDIADLDTQIVNDIIMGLRPVSFKFINGTSDRTHYGLVAQEVEELVNNLGIDNQHFAPLIKTQKEDEEGTAIDGEYVYGLRYAEFIGILIKMCQNLQNEVNEIKSEVATLKN